MDNRICYYCDQPATLLCDGKTETGTCDRPMCAKHVASSKGFIACKRGGKGPRAIADTIDYCPDCNPYTPRTEKPSIPCRVCGQAILIPGLEGSYCSACGWVADWGELERTAAPAPKKRRK